MCFFLRGFGGYSVCPNMCSGSQSHDLQQMVEQKADKSRHMHMHTHKFKALCGESMAYGILYHSGWSITNRFKCCKINSNEDII